MWTGGFHKYKHLYITEGTNLKTFLKENYLIALDSYKLHIY